MNIILQYKEARKLFQEWTCIYIYRILLNEDVVDKTHNTSLDFNRVKSILPLKVRCFYNLNEMLLKISRCICLFSNHFNKVVIAKAFRHSTLYTGCIVYESPTWLSYLLHSPALCLSSHRTPGNCLLLCTLYHPPYPSVPTIKTRNYRKPYYLCTCLSWAIRTYLSIYNSFHNYPWNKNKRIMIALNRSPEQSE